MNPTRIADLLHPFLDHHLSDAQLGHISTYIDLLLRWNARINLTAIRDPEEVVTRHFGESFFAASCLFPTVVEPDARASAIDAATARRQGNAAPGASPAVIDFGSGAGFPGLPIKIWAPHIHLTLIESHQKKATFLREIARALTLTDVNVFSARAEGFPEGQGTVVTLRAVERFDRALPDAARLLAPSGRLALLISRAQLTRAHELLPDFVWQDPRPIPLSTSRILALASRP